MSAARPELHMIVARASNGVIGDGERMPWSLRDDLAYFKRTTMGAPIVMGRRTWASIGRPLPGRRNIVLSRDPSLRLEGAEVMHSVQDVLDACVEEARVFIIGGGEIYRLFADQADVLHITDVDARPEGTVFFPPLDRQGSWEIEECARFAPDERNEHGFVIRVYRRAMA